MMYSTLWPTTIEECEYPRSSTSTASGTTATPTHPAHPTAPTSRGPVEACTGPSGWLLTGLYRMLTRSTTVMATRSTTISRTWNACRSLHTALSRRDAGVPVRMSASSAERRLSPDLERGTRDDSAARGVRTVSATRTRSTTARSSALGVGRRTERRTSAPFGIARALATCSSGTLSGRHNSTLAGRKDFSAARRYA
jgi:hypothetical protein